ncbi:MAG TPA: asparagine synthase C-terminal domain-containing protein, partial [Verrucomicrobiae bacterium]|nr:asparagine synthase C-terminal domain-containing protein [Verrucomicrobiae bacterium]
EDRDLQQVISRLPCIYDEPLADPSQIPTVLLCRLARADVKVSLSGDAGDELFGGYDHYRKTQRVWRAIRWIPGAFRQRLANHLRSFAGTGAGLALASGRARHILNRVSNLTDLLPAPDDWSLYQLLMSPNRDPWMWLRDANEPAAQPRAVSAWEKLPELLQRMTLLDFVSYLPDDILVKVDRAAMSVGLETRVPLLDHRIIEFACRLPAAIKQKGNQGKWVLRQILYRYVPPALVDRPKRGFAAPIAEWLRGPMRDWAEHLLGEIRLRQEGFFDARQIRQRWQEHLAKKRDWSPGLWHVLMFQAWLDEPKIVPGQSAAPALFGAKKMIEAEVCRT